MNRKIMKMASVALVLILAVGVAGSALAQATNVNFTVQGSSKVFVFTPESTDLFQNFKGLMPGDTVQQKITVQNTYNGPVRIWLRCEPMTADHNVDFLNQLALTVKASNTQLFAAQAGQQDGLAPTEKSPYGVLLGTFAKKGSVDLTATLSVPISLGNEYMAQEGVVPWTFTVEEVVLPDTPDTGDDFTLWVWVAVAIALAAAVALLLVKQRRQRT